jgi:hypothetical protein
MWVRRRVALQPKGHQSNETSSEEVPWPVESPSAIQLSQKAKEMGVVRRQSQEGRKESTKVELFP